MSLKSAFKNWLTQKYPGSGTPGSYVGAVTRVGNFFNIDLFDTNRTVSDILERLLEFRTGLFNPSFIFENSNFLESCKSYYKKGFLKPAIENYLAFLFELTNSEIESDFFSEEDYEKIEKAIPLSDEIASNAHENELSLQKVGGTIKIRRKTSLIKNALQNDSFQCCIDKSHKTFLTNKNKKDQYMEGHHLIPLTVKNSFEIKNRFNVNIDCLANIVSLCPTCHKAIHLGSDQVKEELLVKLYKSRVEKFNSIGLGINIDEIKKMYGL